jgi:DoxX-like family
MTREITWLRWSVAAVLGGGAVELLVHGGHGAIGSALAIAELAGSALLVMPTTRRIGAIALAVVLVAACIVHTLVGEWPPPSFAVYAVALLVVARDR